MEVLTWQAGSAGELTWRAGPPHGCDAALRSRGRATSGPREAQVAHRARTRGRRPHVSTRVHADAHEGATWPEGMASEAPTGEWALVRVLGR